MGESGVEKSRTCEPQHSCFRKFATEPVENSDLPPFRTAARSLRQDYDTIRAALTTPWSTGQYEGQICRVKRFKRLGYGRAKLDLLRQRILHRVTTPGASVQQGL